MRFITTSSGSQYITTVEEGILYAHKVDGNVEGWTKVIAVYEDRYEFLEATTKWEWDGGFLCGYNDQGTRTVKLVPDQIRPGQHFWAPGGFWSTAIVDSKPLEQEIREAEIAERGSGWETEQEVVMISEDDLEDAWEESYA